MWSTVARECLPLGTTGSEGPGHVCGEAFGAARCGASKVVGGGAGSAAKDAHGLPRR